MLLSVKTTVPPTKFRLLYIFFLNEIYNGTQSISFPQTFTQTSFPYTQKKVTHPQERWKAQKDHEKASFPPSSLSFFVNSFYMDIKKYLLISLLVVGIDAVYLNTVSNYFNSQIKAIQGTELRLNMISTVMAYLVITLGVYYFMVEKKFSMKDMAILGAFTYSIYEFTNKALFDKWYWKTVALDGLWGGVLFSLIHYFYHQIV